MLSLKMTEKDYLKNFDALTYTQNYTVLNLFKTSVPSLYLLETWKKTEVFWCFQVVQKGRVGLKWIKTIFCIRLNSVDVKILHIVA